MRLSVLVAVAGLVGAGACAGERPPLDAQGRTDGGSATSSFTDVPADHPFAQAMAWIVSRRYMTSCKTETFSFCPDDLLSREWAAVSSVLMKYGESFTPPAEQLFADVPPSYWAFRYIQQLAALGAINGCGDGTSFCPTASLSRAQAASLLIRLKFGDAFSPTATPYFRDVPATHWAFKYVQQAYDAGFTYGCTTAGHYCPDQPITRADWAAFLYTLGTL
jgi:hypothetical protein